MNKEEQNKIECFKAFCQRSIKSKHFQIFLTLWNKLQKEINIEIPYDYQYYFDMVWLHWTDGWCDVTLHINENEEIDLFHKWCDKDSSNLIETTYDEILNNGIPKEILEQLQVFRVK